MNKLTLYKSTLINTIVYMVVTVLQCVVALLLILRIQNQYAGELINLKFNIYEGITVIDSANYVWRYLIYAGVFGVINGLLIWYSQKIFTNQAIQYIIVYWIFGSSVLVLSLLIAYLWLVLRINS